MTFVVVCMKHSQGFCDILSSSSLLTSAWESVCRSLLHLLAITCLSTYQRVTESKNFYQKKTCITKRAIQISNNNQMSPTLKKTENLTENVCIKTMAN